MFSLSRGVYDLRSLASPFRKNKPEGHGWQYKNLANLMQKIWGLNKRYIMQSTASIERQLDCHKVLPKFIKIPTRDSKPEVQLIFSKKDASPALLQEETPNHDTLLQDDYVRATGCIDQIVDPLWKDICMDLLNMMGPASILKIWKSKLGEFSSQDKRIDITCETVEAEEFVQQYDFVILGSLHRYFPALKQLRVRI